MQDLSEIIELNVCCSKFIVLPPIDTINRRLALDGKPTHTGTPLSI